jgi:hypothetical protein
MFKRQPRKTNQVPIAKHQFPGVCNFETEDWNLFGAWDLGIGYSTTLLLSI